MTAYFDNAATTKVCSEAVDAVLRTMTEDYGNPSSGYALGRRAAGIVSEARANVATALGVEQEEVFFTSGGTEGDNWAIRRGCYYGRHKGRHIITSAAEHDAVLQTMRDLETQGWSVTYLMPDKQGRIETEQVSEAVRDDTVFVSIMLVNNETGAISPIREIVKAVREKAPNALIHTDAVQAYLKIPLSLRTLGVDLATVSSHKIHGPKGVGALYIKKGLRLTPMLTGGGQEKAMRPGTENVPAIAGFGAATDVGFKGFKEFEAHMRDIRTYTLKLLRDRIEEVVEIGSGDAPQILNVSFPGYGSEVVMNVLDAAGISVAKSSACKKGARSHVLEAMRLPKNVVDSAIRVSFSRYSTHEEAEYFAETVSGAIKKLRRR